MQRWIALTALALFFSCAIAVSPKMGRSTVHAQFDKPTCKVGVHMISPSDEDFKKAAELLNTNGGDYCWTTVVLREDEMNVDYLQRIHNTARENHIQIIHRIEKGFTASGTWLMPDEKTVRKFIDTMESITPASKDVYVILGNEPTHAAMCGGCTPDSYASWASHAIDMLHEAKFHAVVMLAGQDLHSPQDPPNYYDTGIFIKGMTDAQPQLLCKIDAWASHSYPNNFVGSGNAVGRLSPRGYQWELGLIERLALPDCASHVANLPVFITETGYKVGAGGVDQEDARVNMRAILDIYNQDPHVIASTVFAYKFCGEPFEQFAVVGCDARTLNGVGYALLEEPKTKGDVQHIYQAKTTIECPKELVENLDVICTIQAKNTGTDIWKSSSGEYDLMLAGFSRDGFHGPRYSFSRFREIKPGETLTAQLRYNPGTKLGAHSLTIGLAHSGKLLQALAQINLESYESPQLTIQSENILGNKTSAEEDKAQVQVFDQDENILYRKKVAIADGVMNIGKIGGVGLSGCYRVVLLVEGNLPVQKECVPFSKGENIVEMPRLLPLDRDNDGKLSLSDILSRRGS